MKSDLTEIAFVLDRSGSMASIAPIAIAGFNEFLLAHQAAAGQARLTLVLFDDEYFVPAASLPVQEVVPLDDTTYLPRNTTALLDAIGRTVDDLGQRISKLAEADRPGAVIVAILTDGLENASTQYKWRDVAAKIRHQQDKYQWEFLFLGANQDAIATAAQLNIGHMNSANFMPCDIDSAGGAVARRTTASRAMRAGTASAQQVHDSRAAMQEIADDEAAKKRAAGE